MNERRKNSSVIRPSFKSIFIIIHTMYQWKSEPPILLNKPGNKKILFYILLLYFHFITHHLICNIGFLLISQLHFVHTCSRTVVFVTVHVYVYMEDQSRMQIERQGAHVSAVHLRFVPAASANYSSTN